MAQNEDVAKALEAKKEVRSIQELVVASSEELGKALPEHMRPERLVRIALTCLRINPKLMDCTRDSFLGGLFTLAQVGLEPISGLAYLLPFKNKGKMEVQAVIGYKGIVSLFYRHENALSIEMNHVCKNDVFDFEFGTNSFLKHKPLFSGDRGEEIGYYSIAKMRHGGSTFMFMSAAEAIEHGKKHSKSFVSEEWDKKLNRYVKCEPHFVDYSPWNTEKSAMCKKTVLIQHSKTLPLSSEVRQALSMDETCRRYEPGKGIGNILELPDETEWIESEPQKNGMEAKSLGELPFEK